jgi:hypothetical protein
MPMFDKSYTISEGYFGKDLTPMEVIRFDNFVIYVCVDSQDTVHLYNADGDGACELSFIDIDEFKTVFSAKP